jgi:hypothetical protein
LKQYLSSTACLGAERRPQPNCSPGVTAECQGREIASMPFFGSMR